MTTGAGRHRGRAASGVSAEQLFAVETPLCDICQQQQLNRQHENGCMNDKMFFFIKPLLCTDWRWFLGGDVAYCVLVGWPLAV